MPFVSAWSLKRQPRELLEVSGKFDPTTTTNFLVEKEPDGGYTEVIKGLTVYSYFLLPLYILHRVPFQQENLLL